MNSLLGNIGSNDVEDCGDLTLLALEKFKDLVDPKRVGVHGGSHGGFMTGWLIGHPKYKDLWAAAALWNPVLNMAYMISQADIPDWIYACCHKKELKFAELSAADSASFFDKSPMSVVKNVKTPSLLIIGDKDLRVPPAQAYYYYHALQEQGVESKLYNYPDSGHALLPTEHGIDATLNISLWMDKYLMEPFEEKKQ